MRVQIPLETTNFSLSFAVSVCQTNMNLVFKRVLIRVLHILGTVQKNILKKRSQNATDLLQVVDFPGLMQVCYHRASSLLTTANLLSPSRSKRCERILISAWWQQGDKLQQTCCILRVSDCDAIQLMSQKCMSINRFLGRNSFNVSFVPFLSSTRTSCWRRNVWKSTKKLLKRFVQLSRYHKISLRVSVRNLWVLEMCYNISN